MTYEELVKDIADYHIAAGKAILKLVEEYERERILCKCQITNDICPCHGKRAKKEESNG